MFEAVLCSIDVPPYNEKLRAKFSEFTPIFKNIEVGCEHLGPLIYEYCLEIDLLKQLRRTQNILPSTPLLKWYLEKGLKLIEISHVIQFVQEKCFASYPESLLQKKFLMRAMPGTKTRVKASLAT